MKGVSIEHRQGCKVVGVEKDCEYRGIKVGDLGHFGMNKLENMLFLMATGKELRCAHYCERCVKGEPVVIKYKL